MKVTVEQFKLAFASFQEEFIAAFSTSLQKFVVGAVLAANGAGIDNLLSRFTDGDGMVDVDAMKTLVDAGMKQCGGKLELPINFGVLSSFGALPANIKIDKADVDKFFDKTIPSFASATKKE